jgi:hypothetical protein
MTSLFKYEVRGIRTPEEHKAHEFTARALTNQYYLFYLLLEIKVNEILNIRYETHL